MRTRRSRTSALLTGCLAVGSALAQNAERPGGDSQSQPAGVTSEVLFGEARQCLESGDVARAVDLLERALARRADRVDYALTLSDAYVQAGRVTDARRLLENLRAQYPADGDLRLRLAQIAFDRGESATVNDLLKPIAETLPPEGVALHYRALRAAGERTAAARTLRYGLERFPDRLSLHLLAVDAALENENFALALRYADEAQRAAGESAELALRRARAYFAMDELLGDAAVRHVPGGQVGQFDRDWLLVESRGEGRFLCSPRESALFQVRRALDAGMNRLDAHLLHARIQARVGHPDLAFAILEAQQYRVDGQPELLAELAAFSLRLDRLDDFLRFACRRADCEPERRAELLHEAYVTAADVAAQAGKLDVYRGLLRRAVAVRPDHASTVVLLGDALWSAGSAQEARACYERALSLDPGQRDRRRLLERMQAP